MVQTSVPIPSSREVARALRRISQVQETLPLTESGKLNLARRLHESVDRGNAKETERALCLGADPLSRGEDGRSAYQKAREEGHDECADIVRAHLDATLIQATREGDLEKARECIDAGADVDARDPLEFRETPLMIAAIQNDTKMVGFLLSLGADPAIKDDLDMDVRDWAIKEGSLKVLSILPPAPL